MALEKIDPRSGDQQYWCVETGHRSDGVRSGKLYIVYCPKIDAPMYASREEEEAAFWKHHAQDLVDEADRAGCGWMFSGKDREIIAARRERYGGRAPTCTVV